MTTVVTVRTRVARSARALLALVSLAAAAPAGAAELAGSLTSMRRQHDVAVVHDFAFARTSAEVRDRVARGDLVQVRGNDDYALADVAQPYARAEVLAFVERLGAEYRAATGSRLVVTSLTRPASAQPANAHRLSVHPAGMAVDLRVPAGAKARDWLEGALLAHERAGRLDVTRERHPPHYHVAVFPGEWSAYADSLTARQAAARAAMRAAARDSAARATAPVVATAAATPVAPGVPLGRLGGGLAAAVLAVGVAAAGRRRATTR